MHHGRRLSLRPCYEVPHIALKKPRGKRRRQTQRLSIPDWSRSGQHGVTSLLPGVRMNVGTQTLCRTQDIPRPSQRHHVGGGRFRSNPRPAGQVQHGQMHGATTSSPMGSPDTIISSPPGVHRGHRSAATLLQRLGENNPAKTEGLRSLSVVSIPRVLRRFLA
jgi:hypothetical protein